MYIYYYIILLLAKPSVQRRILAILAMVPIYSITSWLSLVFPSTEVTLSTIRDCYEAYIIYTFMALLIAVSIIFHFFIFYSFILLNLT